MKVRSVLPRLTKFKGIALDLLFPQYCIGCGREGSLICAACYQSLPQIKPPFCPGCGRPQNSEILCPGCTSRPAAIDGIRSPFRFEGAVRQAIHKLKYQNLRALAVPLAKLLQEYLASTSMPVDVLVPVPLHKKRLRERGFNQSALLAQELGKLNDLAVEEGCLIRTRHSTPQARTSSVDERWRSVADAFACRGEKLQGKQILLIDDVSTSGATLDACALKLKAAGAKSVWGLVLAREI